MDHRNILKLPDDSNKIIAVFLKTYFLISSTPWIYLEIETRFTKEKFYSLRKIRIFSGSV